MATNDFLPFATAAGANVLSQSAYAALTAIANGYTAGVAQSNALNKTWRQSSIMAAVLAQFIADRTGVNSVDDGTTATLLANLKKAAASLNGDPAQPFNVANGTVSNQAVNYAQLTAGQYGRLNNIQIFTSSGTYTPTTGTKYIYVELIGGGGGGGGAGGGGAGSTAAGGGGGAGARAIYYGYNPTPQTITIGLGGAGGVGSNNGNAGGTTYLGGLANVTGGSGGGAGNTITTVSTSGAAGAGGQSASASLGVAGEPGTPGYSISTVACIAGKGGGTPWGGGGIQNNLNGTGVLSGSAGVGRGSGGSGACGVNNGAFGAGGAGAPGLIIIYEYQ
jgi:hypothetical protein